MALQKREKNLLILCGVVAVGAVIYQFVIYPAQQKKEAPPASSPIRQVTNMAQPGGAVQVKTAQAQAALSSDAHRYADWGRDPFTLRPVVQSAGGSAPAGEAPKVRAPELKGIFYKGQKGYALIDDVVLAEGEQESGLRVQSIRGQEVLCYKNNRQFRLYWRQSP